MIIITFMDAIESKIMKRYEIRKVGQDKSHSEGKIIVSGDKYVGVFDAITDECVLAPPQAIHIAFLGDKILAWCTPQRSNTSGIGRADYNWIIKYYHLSDLTLKQSYEIASRDYIQWCWPIEFLCVGGVHTLDVIILNCGYEGGVEQLYLFHEGDEITEITDVQQAMKRINENYVSVTNNLDASAFSSEHVNILKLLDWQDKNSYRMLLPCHQTLNLEFDEQSSAFRNLISDNADEEHKRDYQARNLRQQVMHLQTVKMMNLSVNNLSQLPDEFSALSNLERVWLWQNGLSEIPTVLLNLKHLKDLNLEENYLNKVSEDIAKLTELGNLNLDYNILIDLPKSIGKLTHLETLSVRGNQIETLEDLKVSEIKMLANLQELHIAGNPVADLVTDSTFPDTVRVYR